MFNNYCDILITILSSGLPFPTELWGYFKKYFLCMNTLLNVLLQRSPPICNMDFSHVVIFSLLKCVEYFLDFGAMCPTE